jgi:hypothetical protein
MTNSPISGFSGRHKKAEAEARMVALVALVAAKTWQAAAWWLERERSGS